MSREDKKGWTVSIVVHLVLFLALLFWRVEMTSSEPEFVEVSWGTFSNVPVRSAPSAPLSASTRNTKRAGSREQVPVELPERSPTFDKEDPPLPRTRKSEAVEQYSPTTGNWANNGSKAGVSGAGKGEKEHFQSGEGLGESGTIPGKAEVGGDGTGLGKSVAWSMQWGDGGTRRLMLGNLPEYPAGVNVETQIRVEAIVLPSGKVKSLRPVQKGNTRLEDAAMREVRGWIFEPLAASAPQKDQACQITFNFVLR